MRTGHATRRAARTHIDGKAEQAGNAGQARTKGVRQNAAVRKKPTTQVNGSCAHLGQILVGAKRARVLDTYMATRHDDGLIRLVALAAFSLGVSFAVSVGALEWLWQKKTCKAPVPRAVGSVMISDLLVNDDDAAAVQRAITAHADFPAPGCLFLLLKAVRAADVALPLVPMMRGARQRRVSRHFSHFPPTKHVARAYSSAFGAPGKPGPHRCHCGPGQQGFSARYVPSFQARSFH